ncbi:MAG: hypothetical protein R3B07_07400 [Polyangiaceae bacterium]
MQRRATYLALLVGAWLTLGCNDKAKDGGDGTIATPDPSAMGKLMETASALPAASGGSAPASSAPSEAPATEVTFETLGLAEAGPDVLKFTAMVVEHSKCESSKEKPCLKYVIVSERSGAPAPYDKAKDYAVLTPGDPAQYPLGKSFEFSVTVTSSKEVGGTLNDLRLVYAKPSD